MDFASLGQSLVSAHSDPLMHARSADARWPKRQAAGARQRPKTQPLFLVTTHGHGQKHTTKRREKSL
jgi:hypothetical protein